MPWETGSRLHGQPADPGKAWRYEIFGGVYELRRVRDTLVTLYDKDDSADGQREPVRGQSALFACTVDADGVLVEGSAVLSACAWAIGRAVREGDNLTLATAMTSESLRDPGSPARSDCSPPACARRSRMR